MDKQDIIRFAGYLSALYDVLTPIFYLLLLLLCFLLFFLAADVAVALKIPLPSAMINM